jgi:hypothetical protein
MPESPAKTIDERATELGCTPDLVPVIERLDLIIGLLKRLPLTYNRWPNGATDVLVRDLFPEHLRDIGDVR